MGMVKLTRCLFRGAVSVRRPRLHVRLWLGPCRVQPLRPAPGSVISFLFGLFFTRKGNRVCKIAEMARLDEKMLGF